jgi:hypothetical protein
MRPAKIGRAAKIATGVLGENAHRSEGELKLHKRVINAIKCPAFFQEEKIFSIQIYSLEDDCLKSPRIADVFPPGHS